MHKRLIASYIPTIGKLANGQLKNNFDFFNKTEDLNKKK